MGIEKAVETDIVVRVEKSPESEEVVRLLTERGVKFRVAYASPSAGPLPAIETMYGSIRGYDDIIRYLLSGTETER